MAAFDGSERVSGDEEAGRSSLGFSHKQMIKGLRSETSGATSGGAAARRLHVDMVCLITWFDVTIEMRRPTPW